jgi:diguanylate cyclase
MKHAATAQQSSDRLQRVVLTTILALSWVGWIVGWMLIESFGESSVLPVIFAANVVFHPMMALTVWRRLLPLPVANVVCLCFAAGVCGTCMALLFYAGTLGAGIAIEPLYLWFPVIYVLAFTLPSRRLSLAVSLGVLGVFAAISVPYLVNGASETHTNLTIQTLMVSGVLIAALDFLSGYLHQFRLSQLTVDELAHLANTDALTQLVNRRRVTEVIEDEIARLGRYGHPCSVIVFDVDRFKLVNDRYGHGVGDDTLVALAGRTAGAVRDVDTLGRWGGDEFTVVLPETSYDEALVKAEELCRLVAAAPTRRSTAPSATAATAPRACSPFLSPWCADFAAEG